jgi:molybdopterin/thiamine biosynthesis adenylyltransferase
MIQSESVEASSPLLYYLAATGIGNISCVFQEKQGYEILFNNLRDLNSDITISLNEKLVTNDISLRIVLGNAEYVAGNLTNINDSWTPVVIAVNKGWQGYLQVFREQEKMESTVSSIQRLLQQTSTGKDDRMGRTFSTCLIGALTAIESAKLILNIGKIAEKPFSFDLLSMKFNNHQNYEPDNIFLSNGYKSETKNGTKDSKSLSECKALVVGTGGLGSPVAYALVKAGIGTIGLVDHDTVDISNLNRQFLHSVSRIGVSKVDSAEILLRQLNPNVNIIKYHTNFNKENAFEIMADYDVMIDGVDNFPTRFLLNDACYLMKKPMIEAGVSRFDGMGMTLVPDEGMCYRCLFPTIPSPGSVPSCSETGILGPVPGVLGFIEACEAAKLLTGKGTILKDSLLAYDALDLTFDVLQAGKNATCPLCGTNPSIKELQGYEFVCES